MFAWLLAAAFAAVFHRSLPASGWLLVHLALLGAASNALLIWTAHFTRAIVRSREVAGRSGEAARLAAFNAGAIAVVAGLMADQYVLTLVGAVALAVVAGLHAWAIISSVRAALPGRLRAPAWYYAAAAALLVPGAVLGFLLAEGIGPRGPLLAAHASLNILGWIGLPIIATLITLWPTVLHVRMAEVTEPRARRMLPLALAAVVITAFAEFAPTVVPGPWGILLARAQSALGLVGFLAVALAILAPAIWATVARKVTDFPALSIAAGTLWLFGALAVAAVRIALTGVSLATAIAALLLPLVGGIVQILLGSLAYLLPVMAGGGPSILRGRIALVNRGAVTRVIALNGTLLFSVIPGPSLVLVAATLVALAVAIVDAALIALATYRTPRARGAGGTAPGGGAAGAGMGVDGGESGAGMGTGAGAASPGNTGNSLTGGVVSGLAIVALTVASAVALDPAAAGVVGLPGQPGPAPTGQVTRVAVQISGMRFIPDHVSVPAGNTLEIILQNTGTDVHDLVLEDGATTGRLAPGETGQLTTLPPASGLDGWCSVAGHRQMGMVFRVDVTNAADQTTPDQGQGPPPAGQTPPTNQGHGTGAPAQPDLGGTPGPDWQVRDARLAPLDGDDQTEHHVTLQVTEQVVEVAPGVTQSRWTFGGSAPGPVLRGRIGDKFVITLSNDGTIGHSIDFHAGALAPDQPMRTIQPGETLTYRFTATRAGIWMYHCSTMPMSMHIAQGMYGAVIIEPEDLPAVDHEFVLVQGESYLGPEGGESDAAKIAAGNHDLVHFNGYPFQYDHVPLEVGVGERIRIWVLAAGPNVGTSFHVVGGQFDTVWMEGDYRLRPGGIQGGGSQALGLWPAQGGFVELELPEEGNYPFVSHIMSDAEKGAHGILHAASAPAL